MGLHLGRADEGGKRELRRGDIQVFLPLYQTLHSLVAISYNTVESWSATAYHYYPPKNSIECVPRLNFTWNINNDYDK